MSLDGKITPGTQHLIIYLFLLLSLPSKVVWSSCTGVCQVKILGETGTAGDIKKIFFNSLAYDKGDY